MLEVVIIGLCGEGFVEVWNALRVALPRAELAEIGVDAASERPPEVDVLVPLGGVVDATMMEATRPRLIQQFGVGLQGVDLAAARDRGIPVANVPAADTGNAAAVAEVAVLHLLALLRGYRAAQRSVAERRVGQPIGTTLTGKTVTVLGSGAVGTAAASRLAGLHATPLAVGRRELSHYPMMARLLPAEQYFRADQFTTALARSAALIVCCPLTEQTRGLVDRHVLAAMPRGGYVVNVARGPVVDYIALRDALRDGHLAGAGLDVGWSEPMDPADELFAENVTVTPHVGGVTTESYAAMAAAFARNVERLQSGETPEHLVT